MPSSNRKYDHKVLTIQLLRSFCETARLGSMRAAAESLELSQPTIWAQIHSLERHFGTKLVETHTRGCRLSAAGEILLRQSLPLITEFDQLGEKFKIELDQQCRVLRIAALPRACEEELSLCLEEFQTRNPRVRVSLRQTLTTKGIVAAVRSGTVDLGITSYRPGRSQPELHSQRLYDVEFVLLVPRGHPLAKVRIRLEHFAQYPILNSRKSCVDRRLIAALDSVGAFQNPKRKLDVYYHRTVREYVRKGLGIGIVPRLNGVPTRDTDFVERRLTSFVRPELTIYAVYVRSVTVDAVLGSLIEVIRSELRR